MKSKCITLKHLLINGYKMIGLKFYPDKTVHALVKTLPDARWSNKYHMVVLPNTKKNLTAIFGTFKGVAWVNTQHFFTNRSIHKGNDDISVDGFRKRTPRKNWKNCPEEFFQKLEIRKYSLNNRHWPYCHRWQ